MKKSSAAFSRQPAAQAGFTLIEILASLAISVVVLAMVASIMVMSMKIIRKNVLADEAVANTRLFQEHFNREVSMGITDPPAVAPVYSLDSGTTPARSSRFTYRKQIGPVAKVNGLTSQNNTTIVISMPSGLDVHDGDYLMIDSPNLGAGAQIAPNGVDGQHARGNPNTQANVTLTLSQTIAASTTPPLLDVPNGATAIIQRQSAYQTAASAKYPGLYEMRWYQTTARSAPPLPGDTESYIVLSSNLAPSAQYPFIQVAGPSPTPPEPGVGWEFTYAVPTSSATYLGGNSNFYEANHAEGLIMPKSGNPMSTSGISDITTSICTTTTSTTSTSTSTTTSTSTSTSTSISTTTTTTSISTTSTTSTSSIATTTTTTSATTTTSTTSISTSSISTTSTSSTSTIPTTTTSTSTTSSTSIPTTTSTSTSSSTTTTSSVATTTTTSTTSTTTSTTTSISTTTTTTTIVYDG